MQFGAVSMDQAAITVALRVLLKGRVQPDGADASGIHVQKTLSGGGGRVLKGISFAEPPSEVTIDRALKTGESCRPSADLWPRCFERLGKIKDSH